MQTSGEKMTEEDYILAQRLTALRYACDIIRDIECLTDDVRIKSAYKSLVQARDDTYGVIDEDKEGA